MLVIKVTLCIPPSIKNPKLYASYLKLLKKVISDNQQLLDEIWKIKNSRTTFDFNPAFKDRIKSLTTIPGIDNAFADEIWTNEDVSLRRIVDYLIDGLYHNIIGLSEYVNCVDLMSSDEVIAKQVNKSLSILMSHQFMIPWIYLSHFLKSALFDYLNKHQIDIERFNIYFKNLELFFCDQSLDYVDISPLHHFQIVGLSSDNELRKIQCSIILSKRLHIIPLTHENRLRFSNKFPVSTLNDSNDRINYLIEYKYKVRKGLDVQGEIQGGALNTEENFTTIITLFRLLGIHCGMQDILTISDLDLPIFHMGLNLFVSSLGIAYATSSYVSESKLDQFMQLWTEYGNLLVMKILNNKRFEGDPFGNLKISLDRFNISFERKHGTDQFIDNIVALEALYSKANDPVQGITVRLSRRIALFLEKEPKKRKETFCDMIRLYDSRGEIIHGGYTDKIDIVKTREYLTRSYIKYFELLKRDGFNHMSFIKQLDMEENSFPMKRKDCKKKHTHNYEYNYSIPEFLFQ